MKINYDFWRSVLSVTKVSPEAGAPENRSEALQSLVAGQQVKGEVLARLSDQVYLVKIAGDIYRTELPEPARPGAQLTLTYRTSDPRPEFSLQSTRHDAAPVRLSPTVASLSEALKGPAPQPFMPQVKSLEPLLSSVPANTTTLATSLRNALSFSGLFYESHLLQWHLGERLLTDIQKESRSRLATLAKMAKDPVPGENLPAGSGPLDGNRDSLAKTLLNDELPDNLRHIAAPANQLTSALLRDQVETLLSGVFHWQGSVWQDQEMAWDVEKQPGEGDQEGQQSWKTSIRLTLPNLGEVSATLVSGTEGIKGRIITDSTTTKSVMQQELAGLEENLAGAGLTLISMSIEERDEG